MKGLLLILLSLITLSGYAQQGASFGDKITGDDAILATDVLNILGDKDSLNVKVKGTVNEVCQAKGCWMTMDLANGQAMRITFKDYGFFVPTNSSGKVATIAGIMKKEITSVQMLKHYAKDGGKSEAEIEAITQPREDLSFVATGVRLSD